MYAVIEFSPGEGGGVSLVNKDWITPRKKQVFWPPYKEQSQFDRSLKRGEDVNTETWSLFNIKRIFFESDDYDQAFKKLKLAEDTSDIQTEEESLSVRKRKVRRPLKFDSSDDDSDSALPRPPKLLKTKSGSQLKPITFLNTSLEADIAALNASKETPKRTTGVCSEEGPSSAGNKAKLTKSGFEILLSHVLEIKESNKKIIQLLSQQDPSVRSKKPDNFPVQLPINTREELESLERYLAEDNNLNIFASYLSSFGGRDLITRTNRILKELLSDKLASQFNFQGRHAKEAFSVLKLNTTVIQTLQLSCESTVKEIEDIIKIWLKQAPFRIKRKENRNK